MRDKDNPTSSDKLSAAKRQNVGEYMHSTTLENKAITHSRPGFRVETVCCLIIKAVCVCENNQFQEKIIN